MARTTYKHLSEAQSAKAETESELRRAAMEELKVSKNSFNVSWVGAIEETRRHIWYQPLRRRFRTKN